MHTTDTIFAQTTAPGKSGVAVIRISGPQALSALPFFGFKAPPKPRYAHYHSFTRNDELIDQGLILFFPSPHSFTGEDILEFQLHGGAAILKRMSEELGTLPDFRMAEPGEFALRAFLNGKMDLTAAEGLVDLIDAETELQRQQAAKLATGKAAQFYENLRQRIIEPLAHLEAYIDFPDEEIPDSVKDDINIQIHSLISDITKQLENARTGEKIRQGFTVVLLGAPNAGKSTLLNTLAQRDVAIVSEQAGTTRDLIEVHLDLKGIPVILVDTAGLREQSEAIEKEGINRALNRADEADLKLVLLEPSAKIDPKLANIVDDRTIILNTKADISCSSNNTEEPRSTLDNIDISAESGQGIDILISAIHAFLESQLPRNQNNYIVRERHRQQLQKSRLELQKYFEESILELQCERLRLSAKEMEVITGRIDVEDLLDVVFSSFCIGK